MAYLADVPVKLEQQRKSFKASAAIPRIYRLKFQRDIYKDLRILEKSIGEGDEENSSAKAAVSEWAFSTSTSLLSASSFST